MMFRVLVSMVHEHHHEGTCEEEQEWQHAKKVCPMLGEQEEGSHGAETRRGKSGRRVPERWTGRLSHVHVGYSSVFPGPICGSRGHICTALLLPPGYRLRPCMP